MLTRMLTRSAMRLQFVVQPTRTLREVGAQSNLAYSEHTPPSFGDGECLTFGREPGSVCTGNGMTCT